jgi:hypothetical protein
MEALVHNKPHKPSTYAKHCTKAFVLGTSTKHYPFWKFWTPTTHATRISGAAFFKHKYLTNPSVMLEDQVIVAAACLTGHTVLKFCSQSVLQNVLIFSCFPANFCCAEHMNG